VRNGDAVPETRRAELLARFERGVHGADVVVAGEKLGENHELMLISNLGTLVRTRAAEVARVGRNTQGVTLIRLPAEEQLVGLVRVEALGEEGNGADGDVEPAPSDESPTIQ
jgi:DNA gyrase subunit A